MNFEFLKDLKNKLVDFENPFADFNPIDNVNKLDLSADCTWACAIASAFIGGMMWLMLTVNGDIMKSFKDTFTLKQKMVLSFISNYRRNLWLGGFVLGVILALIIFYMTGNFSLSGIMEKGCLFAAIVMITSYFVYTLFPKPTYMIEHLRQDQIDEWLAVKKMMQSKYHMGMLLGGLGCYFLGTIF